MGFYSQSEMGLQQGDPLSPKLLKILNDILAIIIECAEGNYQISGVGPHLLDDGFSILQYLHD